MISLRSSRGIALPIALILTAVVLIAAVALLRNTGQDSLIISNEADRVFAVEATDAAMRATVLELKNLPKLPEAYDPADQALKWWNNVETPISASFWTNCEAAAAGSRCVAESVTKNGRTFTIKRSIQPAGPPDDFGASSGSYTFFYRISILLTLENNTRSEVQAYASRPQLIK